MCAFMLSGSQPIVAQPLGPPPQLLPSNSQLASPNPLGSLSLPQTHADTQSLEPITPPIPSGGGAFAVIQLLLSLLDPKIRAQYKLPLPEIPAPPAFQNQFGIGATFVPAEYVWTLKNDRSFYQGGLLFDVAFRPKARVTLDLSLGVLGNVSQNHVEFVANPGIRVYLHKLPQNPRWFHLAPYVAFSALLSIGGSPLDENQTSFYLGGQLGFGLELRFGPTATLHVDIRGLFRGNAEPGTPWVPQAGLITRAGFGFYF